ncbi:MAG: CYTH domain-containing protein [Proteobacteria bacterium]|nr:CYTH domain-containing protein [Pseudomonadota bacterium]
MGREIERKFLLAGDHWRGLVEGITYRQGYLCADRERTVRVRLAGDRGFLTIKGPTAGAGRDEYEYEIPAAEARAMLDTLCPQPQIEKKRYTIAHQGHLWEVDEFFGANQGLVLAEIELAAENEPFTRPDWLGREVTAEVRYANAMLCRRPYCDWPDTEK